MATSITMPQLGESVTEGTIGRWLKSVGERVERDEPLVEVITDKVNVEVPSPEAGVLARIAVEEGQTVPVGTEICMIDVGGAAAEGASGAAAEPSATAREGAPSAATAPAGNGPAPQSPPAPAPAAPTGPATASAAPSAAASAVAVAARPAEGEARTSPLVRRLAREHGIDLAQIPGTGLGGRVTREDIQAFIARQGGATATAPAESAAAPSPSPAPAAPAPAAPGPAPTSAGTTAPTAPGQWAALSPMRRAIAEHMVRSVSTAPHVTTAFEIDMSAVARLREQVRGEFRAREGFDLSYLPFVAKAVVEALREHPVVNARYEPSEGGQPGIRYHAAINLGVAIGLDDGLVVPVVRDADGLSIAGIARAVRDLVERARAGKLTMDDLRGGTITLNNTGAFGSIQSNPIINQGQAGIITMEAIVRRPVVVVRDGEETIAIRSMMYSCLTFDHRVLDGLQAGRFMQSVKRRLEAVGPGAAIY